MINYQEFLDKPNYRDIWLRDVLVGFLAFVNNKITWVNHFEDEDIIVKVPFYASLAGDKQFNLDSFKDDMSIDRVEMNVDTVPRGSVFFQNWAFKPDEFSNPNAWISQQLELDDELIEISTQCKMMPIKINAHVDLIVDSEIDVMKAWQSMMYAFFIYKFFTYTHKRLPINAVFNVPTDMENPIVREQVFGTKDNKVIPLDFEIHTVFPILDYKNSVRSNMSVEWILETWMQNQIIQRRNDIDVPEGGLRPY